ncbi:LysR family transcriptional regulator [Paraburkholderia sp. C35]|uniref:LysR family transcriptional regulator n=1 Tax=Paraburkholderia sp. C35 TaxID=2126993 RepID=UPI000D68B2A3|nr:LysR family transcriptional regulator [Paraburkholderia sp. C35]
MDLKRLRYFVEVAKMSSFTEAARSLHMAQPPLSQRIREIEQEVGTTLFNRQVRPLALTPAGRLFYDQAVHVLRTADAMDTTMRKFVAAERPRFVLGLVPAAFHANIPRVIEAFCTQAPDVEFSVRELSSVEQIVALKDGRIDAGLCGPIAVDTDISLTELFAEGILAAVPTSWNPGKRIFDLKSLVNRPLVSYPSEPRPSFADVVLDLYREHGIQPGELIEVRELHTALVLVAAGRGISLVPESATALAQPGVRYVKLAQPLKLKMMLCHRGGDQSAQLSTLQAALKRVIQTGKKAT